MAQAEHRRPHRRPRPNRLGPWRLYRYAEITRPFATLDEARRWADLYYRLGVVRLEHETTGEAWRRTHVDRWEQVAPPRPGHAMPDTIEVVVA